MVKAYRPRRALTPMTNRPYNPQFTASYRGLGCPARVGFRESCSRGEAGKAGGVRIDVPDIACNPFRYAKHGLSASRRPRPLAGAAPLARSGDRNYPRLFGRPGPRLRAGLGSVMQQEFEQHVLDELRRAHVGHSGEFLSGRPRLAGQREKPVYAGLWRTHKSSPWHIAGQ
jgi:hypothetical protein